MTKDQAQLLCNWDLIILDPLQPNVVNAVASIPKDRKRPLYVVGRIDLEKLLDLSLYSRDLEKFTLASFERIFRLMSMHIQHPDAEKNTFTGILFAGWETLFSIPVLNKLSKHLHSVGLDVYLEIGPPNFLHSIDAIAAESIAGLVIRNGLILPNGERRDCFAMESLRTTIKAFISQECLRGFTTMMWEQLDDDVVVPDAVVKRTFSWCRFHSTIPWIAPTCALLNAQPELTIDEPLSAFDWLKNSNVMEIHDLWKHNRTVRLLFFSHVFYFHQKFR